jgi:hypothetical protein
MTNACKSLISNPAGNRDRTDDLLITNQLLYQLSYAGVEICAIDLNGEPPDPQTEFV